MKLHPYWLLALLALSSCLKTGPGAGSAEAARQIPLGGGIPPQLRSGQRETATAATSPASNPKLELTPEEDIVFTDPDNPDASLPELSTLLAAVPKRRGPWEESETLARKRAIREGKPLLIWFTDSAKSPMCKALSQELFNRQDFADWADEKLVRLKVDSNVRADRDKFEHSADAIDHELELKAYVTSLKKRYKVLGQPVLLFLNSSGEVVGRYRGYSRGGAEFLWGQLKHAEHVSEMANKSWRENLERKGYREWRDRGDRRVFAKLVSYSDGTLVMVEPDGTRCKTREDKLSPADREWIASQKKLRGL